MQDFMNSGYMLLQGFEQQILMVLNSLLNKLLISLELHIKIKIYEVEVSARIIQEFEFQNSDDLSGQPQQ